jgi:hypothetical protein
MATSNATLLIFDEGDGFFNISGSFNGDKCLFPVANSGK